MDVIGDRRVENSLALLSCNNAPCTERSTVSDRVDFQFNRHVGVSCTQEVAVHRVGSEVLFDGLVGSEQALRDDLAAK